MKDLIFVSEKPYDEVEKAFENADFFSGIMDGLEEALAYEQGKAKAETYMRKRSLPDVNVAEEYYIFTIDNIACKIDIDIKR